MAKALINNQIILWALNRADLSEDELAAKLQTKPDKVASWIEGEDRPTFNQAQKVASALGIPFGYLFLDKPPAETADEVDFRTVGSVKKNLDVNTQNFLQDVLFKQDWFREYRTQQGHGELAFVGSVDRSTPPENLAKLIRNQLGWDDFPKKGNHEERIRQIVSSAERMGIWVMRTSVVGNNTHRPLDVSVFRGAAISDRIAPLIIINSKDAKSAQLFTLAHELAHIWLGNNSISNINLGETKPGSSKGLEAYCNKVAAEILTPRELFISKWNPAQDLDAQIDHLATNFRVSKIVVARRALELGLIDGSVYSEFYKIETARWAASRAAANKSETRIAPQVMLPVRFGQNFTRSVLTEAVRGSILLREASALLGVKPSNVRKIYNNLRV